MQENNKLSWNPIFMPPTHMIVIHRLCLSYSLFLLFDFSYFILKYFTGDDGFKLLWRIAVVST